MHFGDDKYLASIFLQIIHQKYRKQLTEVMTRKLLGRPRGNAALMVKKWVSKVLVQLAT